MRTQSSRLWIALLVLVGACAPEEATSNPDHVLVEQNLTVSDAPTDSDGDGWPDKWDCAPDDPTVNYYASEVTENGVDDDCVPETADVVTTTNEHLNVERLLYALSSTTIELGFHNQVEITILALAADDVPVVGQEIDLNILSPTPVSGAVYSVTRTNQFGLAESKYYAGTATGNVDIVISADDLSTIVRIQVVEPDGCCAVDD